MGLSPVIEIGIVSPSSDDSLFIRTQDVMRVAKGLESPRFINYVNTPYHQPTVDGKDLDAVVVNESLVFFTDSSNHVIRTLNLRSPSDCCPVYAGTGATGIVNSRRETSKFTSPRSLAVDLKGAKLFINERSSHLRQIDFTTEMVSTVYQNSLIENVWSIFYSMDVIFFTNSTNIYELDLGTLTFARTANSATAFTNITAQTTLIDSNLLALSDSGTLKVINLLSRNVSSVECPSNSASCYPENSVALQWTNKYLYCVGSNNYLYKSEGRFIKKQFCYSPTIR